MKHAYLIMAHTDFALLKTLIAMLDDERNDIYLHVDKKAPDFNRAAFKTTDATLHVLSERLDVRWGHVSQIRLELLLFETAWKNGGYAYYHILSGVDLPIKSQDYIHDFFAQNQGKEFVGFWQQNDWQARNRVSRYFFFMRYEQNPNRNVQIFTSRCRKLLLNLQNKLKIKRKLDFDYKKGPNWVSITHDFCGYLLSRKKWILSRFKYTECGDEIFLQSLLWNSPFRQKLYDAADVDNGCMREIDWKRGSATSPYTWRSADFERLMQSDKLFARKFDTQLDYRIIEQITMAVNNK